jgi:energy-converting hydrogenase A subunit M
VVVMLKIDEKYKKDSLEQKYNIIRDNRYIMEEVIVPISKVLNLPIDEVVEIFVRKCDSATLYELHAYAEQAKMGCLGRKVDIDLGLCWLSDFFGLISKKDADLIRKKVVESHILYKKPYKEALEEGRKLIIQLLKE